MRVLVTGASGQLGPYLVARLRIGGADVVAWSGTTAGDVAGVPLLPIDLADDRAVRHALVMAHPDAVIHAGAVSSIEGVRKDPERSTAINVGATRLLAGYCGLREIPLAFTSTDLVFDGSKPWQREDDPPRPLNGYGRSKAEAEEAVLAIPTGLVARLSLQFGTSRSGRESYFDRALVALRRGEPQTFFLDEFRTPQDLATTADMLVRLLEIGATGTVHVAGAERVSRFDLMRRVAEALGLDASLVGGNLQAEATFAEPRPADVTLDTTRLATLLPDFRRPTIEEAARLWGTA